MRIRRLTAVLALALGLSLTLPGMAGAQPAGGKGSGPGAGPKPPATTSGQCFLGCSESRNQSQASVYIGRNWCRSDSSDWPGDTIPSCTSDGVVQEFRWISAGQNSPAGQDWDTFRVDGGWCYSVTIFTYPGPFRDDRVHDRRGLNGLWIKVANNQTAYITSQGVTHC
jgi:hypothetical protein